MSNNGLIDLMTYEMERATINPWTQEEKEIFMEMLAAFGEDFIKISSFLTNKTPEDCIQFYYKNHKLESLEDVKSEVNDAPLDIWGEASTAASHCNANRWNQQEYAGRETASGGGLATSSCVMVLNGSATSSCVINSIDAAENIDEDMCSDEGCGEVDSDCWTAEEKDLFFEAFHMYGLDFSKVSDFVGTRSREQCIIFFNKAWKSLWAT